MTLWSLNNHRLTTWRLGRKLFGFDAEFPEHPSGLLVGECRGPNTDARTPLFPFPTYSAAGRLIQYAGLAPQDYLGRLERVNQCVDEWSDEEAAIRMRDILAWIMQQPKTPRVLLLGRRVQKAWNLGDQPAFGNDVWFDGDLTIEFAWIAHPSGLSRTYNDADTRVRAGRAVRWCAGLEDTL